MKRLTMRTLVDLLADLTISQATEADIKRLKTKYEMPNNEFLYGCYLNGQNRIYVRKNMPHADKVRTLLHELAHAYSRKIREFNQRDELDEDAVEALAAKWHRDLYGVVEDKTRKPGVDE